MNEMIITTVVSTLTAISGFWYGWQKDKKDLVSTSLNNIQLQITIYEEIIAGLRNEVERLVKKIDDQDKIIQSLEVKIDSLK